MALVYNNCAVSCWCTISLWSSAAKSNNPPLLPLSPFFLFFTGSPEEGAVVVVVVVVAVVVAVVVEGSVPPPPLLLVSVLTILAFRFCRFGDKDGSRLVPLLSHVSVDGLDCNPT